MFKYRLGTAPSDALEPSAGSLLAFQHPAPLGNHVSRSELYKLFPIGLRDADSNFLSQLSQFRIGQLFSTLHRQQRAIDHVAGGGIFSGADFVFDKLPQFWTKHDVHSRFSDRDNLRSSNGTELSSFSNLDPRFSREQFRLVDLFPTEASVAPGSAPEMPVTRGLLV